jgi:hypothetical protein
MAAEKKVLEQIVQRLTDLTIGNNPSISYADVESSQIPTAVKTLVLSELEFAARSVLSSVTASRFNFQAESLGEAKKVFAKAVAQTAVLQRDEFLKLLTAAVQLQSLYLLRPQETLRKSIYGKKEERTAAEITDRLSRFTEYHYLTFVFQQYLEKKQVKTLSLQKFEKLLYDIDRKIAANYEHEDFASLIEPIYEFFSLASNAAATVATDDLKRFFEEKDAWEVSGKLGGLIEKGMTNLTLNQFKDLLSGSLAEPQAKPIHALPKFPPVPPKKEVPPAAAQASPIVPSPVVPPPAPTIPPPPKAAKPVMPPPLPEESVLPLPSQAAVPPPVPNGSPLFTNDPSSSELIDDTTTDIFLERKIDFEAELNTLQAAVPVAERKMYPPPQEISPEEFKTLIAPLPPPLPKDDGEKKLKDLEVFISEEDEKRIVKRLFNKNESLYRDAISVLNKKKTWREASAYIDEEVFQKLKVDEYTREAVLFTDIVFSRYKDI